MNNVKMPFLCRLCLLWLTAFFYCASSFAQQQVLVEKIDTNNKENRVEGIAQFPLLSVATGHFKQRKYFKVLKQPIKSTGDIFFDSKLGFLWQTNTPIFSVMLLKNSGLYSYNDNNIPKKINGADSLAQIMMGAMSGDFSQLEQEFTITQAPQTEQFKSCLQLTPKENNLAKIIQFINLCHQSKPHPELEDNFPYKHQLNLVEVSGNRTEIDFSLKAVEQLSESVRAQLQ